MSLPSGPKDPRPSLGQQDHVHGKALPGGIKRVFTDLNRKFQEEETQRLAKTLSLSYIDLGAFPFEQAVFSLVSRDEVVAAEATPFYKEGPLLKVGMTNPQNSNLQKFVASLEKHKYRVELYLISPASFDDALAAYPKQMPTYGLKHEVLIGEGLEITRQFRALAEGTKDVANLSASELISIIMGAAVTMHSSDVHLEPEKNELKVRFRVDGVLQDMADFPLSIIHGLLSRIKLLSGLKLNVTASSQDGRYSLKLPDRILDIRVSALPSAYGESIVMRILGIQDVGLEIEKLGLRGRALKVINQQLDKPNGMTLTTGPTGSGKTTTLYAFLSHLNEPGVKIITLEDPVEYQIQGIIQTPIDRAAGNDFAQALRAMLRQDPDIIMVGEIRDFETAETASQAALTGHIVLSTLHTNDAAGAIPRMLDLGVKPVTLAPALNSLIAQRLVRKICQVCKQVQKLTPEESQRVKLILSQIPKASELAIPEQLTFYHSPGCEECHNLGYRGRVGVFEVFEVDDTIETLIFKQASTVEIKKAAMEQGMVTMQQDGVVKALEGITDLAEVWRVTED
jgi:type II secretory ATPase GspE/PulE/Tfp pilus assembly ATPase PilB-like protein